MIAGLLNRRLEVRRATAAPDGQGGQSRTWTVVATVPARLSQPSDTERTSGAQHGVDITHSVYLAPTADVRRGDELRLLDGDGEVLDVEATLRPSAPAYLRADCTARQREG